MELLHFFNGLQSCGLYKLKIIFNRLDSKDMEPLRRILEQRNKGFLGIKIDVDESQNIIYVRLSGRILDTDVKSAFLTVTNEERYLKGMKRLWDLTDADLSGVNTNSMKKLAEVMPGYSQNFGKTKIAVVVTKKADFRMARDYGMLTCSDHYLLCPFRTVEKAKEWLSQ